jgi:hypothetical protein
MNASTYLRVIVCLGLTVVLLAYPAHASACSCVRPGLPAREFRESHAVFTGKVLRIVDEYLPIFSMVDKILTTIRQSPYFWSHAGKYVGFRIYFGVNDSWKGVEETTVVVDTGYGMGDCGYPFVVSNEYLVYASYPYGIPDNYWVTSICSRNAEISAATEDLRYLKTLPTLSLSGSGQIFGLPVETVLLWATMVLMSVVIFAYVRKLSA